MTHEFGLFGRHSYSVFAPSSATALVPSYVRHFGLDIALYRTLLCRYVTDGADCCSRSRLFPILQTAIDRDRDLYLPPGVCGPRGVCRCRSHGPSDREEPSCGLVRRDFLPTIRSPPTVEWGRLSRSEIPLTRLHVYTRGPPDITYHAVTSRYNRSR